MIMKKMMLLLAFFVAVALTYAHAEDCKVLVPALSGEYVGGCNRGLAHGAGKATGTDTYEGNFRRGYPHGQGTYTWADGRVYEGRWRNGLQHGIGKLTYMENERQVVVQGVWNNGELKSEDSRGGTGYTINAMRRIDAVRVIQIGEGANVIVKITRFGSSLNYSDMIFTGSSGQSRRHGDEIRFENVTFPFRASLRYSVSNKMRTGGFQCELDFTIEEPGTWDVITQQ